MRWTKFTCVVIGSFAKHHVLLRGFHQQFVKFIVMGKSREEKARESRRGHKAGRREGRQEREGGRRDRG